MSRHLAALAAGLVLLATAAAAQPPPFILKWGALGSAPGEFNLPRRLAVAPDGTVYVSDRNNQRIQKFDGAGNFITAWGGLGSEPGEFDFPFGIAVDAAHVFIYTVERNNNRVQKFTTDGTFVMEWGVPGFGDGQFNFPVAVDVGPTNNVFVGDSFNHRIQKFTSEGQFVKKWGSLGSAPGQFNLPIGIAVDNDGNVYVGDSANHRVQKFTSGGAYITSWGGQGSADGEFQSPRGIGVDAENNIYVADILNSRVQKFTSDGVFLTKWGSSGTGDGKFDRLEDVDVDANGSIFVADAGNHRIQKFGFDSVPVTLLSLAAERRGIGAVVSWQVQDGAAHDAAFIVMRESGGAARVQVSRDPLRGSSSYNFVDATAPLAATSYWLIEIDAGGERYLHGPVRIPAAAIPFTVSDAFPNPFNPSTRVTYMLPSAGRVHVSVVDVTGRTVRVVEDAFKPAGPSTTAWDGKDDRGASAASGVYFMRLRYSNRTHSVRMTLLK